MALAVFPHVLRGVLASGIRRGSYDNLTWWSVELGMDRTVNDPSLQTRVGIPKVDSARHQDRFIALRSQE